MLPKIRPAMANGGGRPSIRPVQPAPPPPRPASKLPKKIDSGFAPRGQAAMREPYGSEGDQPTRIGAGTYEQEPPTQAGQNNRGSSRDPMAFDDETQARPVDDHLIQQSRSGMDAPYESLPSLEVRRPFDTYEREFQERDPAAARVPTPAPRRSTKQLREEQAEPSYPIPVEVGSGARERPMPPSPWDDRRDSSGPQQRYEQEPVIPQAPRVPRDARPISEPPPGFVRGVQPIRTPQSAPPSTYAQGAQPMQRTMPPRSAEAMRMQQMQLQAQQAQLHAQMQQRIAHQQAQQIAAQHQHQQQMQMQQRAAAIATGPALSRVPAATPSVGTQTQAEGSKAGRFAWFVFGAAFGIAFAFFATGFRFGAKEQAPEALFPPAPALPAATATTTASAAAPTPPPAATTPAPTTSAAAPIAPTASAAPVAPAPTTTTAAAAPTVVPGFAIPPTVNTPAAPPPVAAPPVAAAPVAAAPSPFAQPTATATSPFALPSAPQAAAQPVAAPQPPPPVKYTPPTRRTWSPPPSPPRRAPAADGPKPLNTGSSASESGGGGGDLGDILGGALKP